jgi:hypothetical protein
MRHDDDRPDRTGVDRWQGPFTLVEGPDHVRAPEESPLPAWYEAVFVTGDGRRVTRFLSDMGRAQVLARRGEGQTRFTPEEFDRWTTPAEVEAITSRYDAEAGQGA